MLLQAQPFLAMNLFGHETIPRKWKVLKLQIHSQSHQNNNLDHLTNKLSLMKSKKVRSLNTMTFRTCWVKVRWLWKTLDNLWIYQHRHQDEEVEIFSTKTVWRWSLVRFQYTTHTTTQMILLNSWTHRMTSSALMVHKQNKTTQWFSCVKINRHQHQPHGQTDDFQFLIVSSHRHWAIY